MRQRINRHTFSWGILSAASVLKALGSRLWNQGLVTLANLARGFCVSGLKLVSGTDKFMPTGVNNNSQRWLEIIGKLVRKLYCVSLRQTPSSDCAHGHNARQNDLEAGLGTRRFYLTTN